MDLDEAKKMINEAVKEWHAAGNDDKIISLAKFAEKWRSTGGGHAGRMRKLRKNINALNLVIKRSDAKLIEPLNAALMDYGRELADLEAKFGKLPPKKIKTLNKASGDIV